jgi:hypothetical protein
MWYSLKKYMNISKKHLGPILVVLVLLLGGVIYKSGLYLDLFKSFAQIPFTLTVDTDSSSQLHGEISLDVRDSTFPLLSRKLRELHLLNPIFLLARLIQGLIIL